MLRQLRQRRTETFSSRRTGFWQKKVLNSYGIFNIMSNYDLELRFLYPTKILQFSLNKSAGQFVQVSTQTILQGCHKLFAVGSSLLIGRGDWSDSGAHQQQILELEATSRRLIAWCQGVKRPCMKSHPASSGYEDLIMCQIMTLKLARVAFATQKKNSLKTSYYLLENSLSFC